MANKPDTEGKRPAQHIMDREEWGDRTIGDHTTHRRNPEEIPTMDARRFMAGSTPNPPARTPSRHEQSRGFASLRRSGTN